MNDATEDAPKMHEQMMSEWFNLDAGEDDMDPRISLKV